MLSSAVIRIVDFCVQRRWQVVVFGFLLAVASATYDVRRFSITTDTDSLISQKLPWHQRQAALSRAFPQQGILIVVTAATPENAEQATNALERELLKHSDLYHSVVQADSGEFFQHNGLLFEPLSEVKKSIEGLSKAKSLIGELAYDPTLRGVMKTLSFVTGGVQGGEVKLDQLVWPLSIAERTLSDVLAGKPATFSWQELIQGSPSSAMRLHHFIEVQPVLDFEALQPGGKATDAIRRSAADLKLGETFGAKVALTGPVPLNDDQFSVIRQSALGDTLSALLGALVILWLALRSWKIVGTVFFSLIVGLAVTAALGVAMVGAFNLISIAFFVLFVGLGVDFGIQFSVRYRSERHEQPDLRKALQGAAGKVGDPLTLAAAATAVAFFSFLPTSYRGLFELGLIAGCGMLIAFFCSITLVPAMLAIVKPPAESAAVGFSSLAPLDDFLQRHRISVIVATIGVVLAGTPLLFRLPVDFNPINLENPNAASVVTFRELQGDPETRGNDADVLAASLDEANGVAKRLAALPEVARTRTLSDFIPGDQDEKIAAIKLAAHNLDPALNSAQRQPAPSDRDTVDAIRKTANDLAKVAGNATGPGAEAARNASGLLTRLADSNAAMRRNAEAAAVPSLVYDLDRLRDSLDPQPVTVNTLPPDLVRDWISPDGHTRVEALPKGNANDNRVLRKFVTSVLAAEPSATGPAISLYESGRTVTAAFIEAGVLALAAIALLLLIALRRLTDVLLTLIPLLLAGIVTLEICALTDTAINFANIIALPLLLGVGVAFKIYYIMAWRDGKTGLLQSALTRAVIFSAMTNAVAFGSMWASNYPGISSMGRMMALALLCTMAGAVLFQPVLMGPPRQIKTNSPSELR
jgi:hopanoid biosynthesis associated RND transporter like protein HpnN